MSKYRILHDQLGLTHHVPRKIENAHITTAAIHRGWAKWYETAANQKLAHAHNLAADWAEANDKDHYNQVVHEKGITGYDFLWRRQLAQQQMAA